MARDPKQNWMMHLPMVLLGIRASIREDSDVSPAHLVFGVPLRLPGQFFDPPASPDSSPSPSVFASELESSLASASPMPVVFHGNHPVRVPGDLASAKSVYVRVDSVQPPLHRPYVGPFPVLSRSSDLKTFRLRKNNKDWVVSTDRLKAASPMVGSSSVPGPSPAVDVGVLDPADLSSLPATEVSRTDLVADPVLPAAPVPVPGPAAQADLVADPVLPAAPVPAPEPAAQADHLRGPASPYRTRAGRASVPPDRFVAG